MKSFNFVITLMFLSASCLGAEFQTPLTQYGHPNFQGVWNFSSSTPLERSDSYGETEYLTQLEISELQSNREQTWAGYEVQEEDISSRILSSENATSVGSVNLFWAELSPIRENSRTSLIVYPLDGKIPPVHDGVLVQRGDQTGIREIAGQRPVRYTHGGIARNGPRDRGLSERCLVFNSGPPLRSGPYNNNIQIIQNADHVVILTEMGFDARIIPLMKKNFVHENIKLWSGDSLGYFEANTLVVETRNFTDQIASLGFPGIAYGDAEARHLTERFSLTGSGTLDYEFTIDDPATFTDKIVAVIPMSKTNSLIYEYACHEGNYALAHILASADR